MHMHLVYLLRNSGVDPDRSSHNIPSPPFPSLQHRHQAASSHMFYFSPTPSHSLPSTSFFSSPSSSAPSCTPCRRWCTQTPSGERLNRLGPENGDDTQIWWFGGCLLITYVPCGGRVRVMTPDWG